MFKVDNLSKKAQFPDGRFILLYRDETDICENIKDGIAALVSTHDLSWFSGVPKDDPQILTYPQDPEAA